MQVRGALKYCSKEPYEMRGKAVNAFGSTAVGMGDKGTPVEEKNETKTKQKSVYSDVPTSLL